MHILKNETNIIEYNQLYNVYNIDDVLKNGSCVILYTTKRENGLSSGHWCCVVALKNKICFFDPYGYIIDDEIKNFIDTDFGDNYYK